MKLGICVKILVISNPWRKPASHAACTKRYYMININIHTNANVNFRAIIIKILLRFDAQTHMSGQNTFRTHMH